VKHGGEKMREEITEILQRAIDIEVFGNHYYNKLTNIVEEKEGKALLNFLAKAEEEHKERLEKMLIQYGGQAIKTEIDSLVANILMDEGVERIFKDLINKDKLEKIDAIEATKLGMDVEAKSIKFYEENAKKSPEADLKDLFTELTSIEKEHFDLLKENLRTLKDEGIWYGYVPILEG
jgi:rubrerythrin